MSPHEEFLRLCAVSVADELSDEERQRLDLHLQGCQSCREALQQFQEAVQVAVPGIATVLPISADGETDGWSTEIAEARFFERLAKERSKTAAAKPEPSEYFPPESHWRQVWMSYAAAILLFLALAISAYRVGIRKGGEAASSIQHIENPQMSVLERQISDLSREQTNLKAELSIRDATIADLHRQIGQMNASARAPGTVTPHDEQQFANERSQTRSQLASLQTKLDEAEKARSEESIRAQALETKVQDLTEQLGKAQESVSTAYSDLQIREENSRQQERQLAEQKELLDHDRDIRELMGARELYIAEVRDVAKDASTQKSYGRVFFTKGKSLIFYAYDLDRQPGLKNASTFQAWGQRGTDREQSLNLGVFYEDSISKKRWILKFDDPQKLAQVDAVFVTVEPTGGSPKPSGQPFLFAYLKVNPNHP